MGVSGQCNAQAALYPRGGGWVGLRAGLDTETRVKSHFASAVDRTPIARSSSPYRHYTD
jgi:hypothetical protein